MKILVHPLGPLHHRMLLQMGPVTVDMTLAKQLLYPSRNHMSIVYTALVCSNLSDMSSQMHQYLVSVILHQATVVSFGRVNMGPSIRAVRPILVPEPWLALPHVPRNQNLFPLHLSPLPQNEMME